ncbi:MAG: hypothetical protein ABID61_02645 [Candidatus Micrarchaeota archaeon]
MRLKHEDCTSQCSDGKITKRNYFSRAKQFVASCLSGTLLVSSSLAVVGIATTQSCGSNQEQQSPSVSTTSAKTDSSGTASFDVNGSQFRLNFFDFETQAPVSDLLVVLSAKEGNGVYQTHDPNNVYVSMFEGVEAINYHATGSIQSALVGDASSFGEGTNVFIKKRTQCSGGEGGFNDGLQGKLPEEIFNDTTWKAAHLKSVTDTAVSLSELDNYLEDIIKILTSDQVQTVGEDIITKEVVPAIVKLVSLGQTAGKVVATNVEKTFGFVGLLTLTADVCSIVEKQSWAWYYRSLCYGENAKFKIYKVTDAWEAYVSLGDLGAIGFETPQLVVLPDVPVSQKPTWTPAAAKVSGSIYYRDSAIGPAWKTPETLAKVKFESHDAPYGEVSIYSPMQGNGSYTFIAGACNDPTYAITGEMPVPPLMLQGTTTLKVQNGQEYRLDFYFDKACAFNGNTYETYSKEDVNGEVSLAVACTPIEGYLPVPGTCKVVLTGFSEDVNYPYLSIYGDYVATASVANFGDFRNSIINYANLKTGETGSISAAEVSLGGIARASNIWENKLVLLDALGSYRLFDLEQKTTTELPIPIGFNVNSQSTILSDGRIFHSYSTNTFPNVYDLNGNLVESIPEIPNPQALALGYSFFGSRIVESSGGNQPIYLYELGSNTWTTLPITGGATINGDNILFGSSVEGDQSATFGVFNIATGEQTTFHDITLPNAPFSGPTWQVIVNYAYWGDNVALLSPTCSGCDPSTSLYVFNFSSESLQEVFQTHGYQTPYGIAIYQRNVAIAYSDIDSKSYVVVCNF